MNDGLGLDIVAFEEMLDQGTPDKPRCPDNRDFTSGHCRLMCSSPVLAKGCPMTIELFGEPHGLEGFAAVNQRSRFAAAGIHEIFDFQLRVALFQGEGSRTPRHENRFKVGIVSAGETSATGPSEK